jgi:hypothetical protein
LQKDSASFRRILQVGRERFHSIQMNSMAVMQCHYLASLLSREQRNARAKQATGSGYKDHPRTTQAAFC